MDNAPGPCAILLVPILLLPAALGRRDDPVLGAATFSVLVLRTGMLARWVGWAGLVASVLYLFNQGDILATAVGGFPVFDLAEPVGSRG
jgi:hypothetical protein